jgi:hypothetical protein
MKNVMTRPPARRRPGRKPQQVAKAENERASAARPGGRIVVGVDD